MQAELWWHLQFGYDQARSAAVERINAARWDPCFAGGKHVCMQTLQNFLWHQAESHSTQLLEEPQAPQSFLQKPQKEVKLVCLNFFKSQNLHAYKSKNSNEHLIIFLGCLHYFNARHTFQNIHGFSCFRLQMSLGMDSPTKTEDEPSPQKKKIHQVSSQSDNPTKITIKTTIMEDQEMASSTKTRKRKAKETEENQETKAMANGGSEEKVKDREPGKISVVDKPDKNSVHIRFDHSTKKLWQDLHFPYGSFTSFFRHLMLLERYWRKGDLQIAENAGQKAKNYLLSVRNRVEAYEGSHKRSDAELSASTRPDLSKPPPPDLLHTPEVAGECSPVLRASKKPEDAAILKVPKVRQPRFEAAEETVVSSPSPSTTPPQHPTKIRVRTDLMYLGLMEKGSEPNLMNSESNLMQLLNGPPLKANKASSNPAGAKVPTLGKVPLVSAPPEAAAIAHAQSSNRHLFQNSSGSSAIPLTFNNSIAEVLAAAKKSKEAAATSGPKPDVTITAKPTVSESQKLHQRLTSTPSKPSYSNPQGSDSAKSPLTDMSKLLLTQAPAVAPHLVAQNSSLPSLPSRSATATSTSSKHFGTGQSATATPTAQSKSARSLNNVLDRLKSTTGPATSSSAPQAATYPPQLSPYQHLAAASTSKPNFRKSPQPKASTASKVDANSIAQAQVAALAQQAAMNPELGLLLGLHGSRPSVSEAAAPWGSTARATQQQHHAAQAAQTALLMAGAGHLPGINPVAAAAAMQELMKMSLMGQQPTTAAQLSAAAAAAEQAAAANQQNAKALQSLRLRAPPPLTHMGRPGPGSGGASGSGATGASLPKQT